MHGSRGILAAPMLPVLLLLTVLTGPLTACSSGRPGSADSPATSPSSRPPTPSGSASRSSPSTPSSTPSGVPSVAGQVTGTGYRFSTPDGWTDATARFRARTGSVDRAAAQGGRQSDGFADNVNVVVAGAGGDAGKTPAEFSAAAVRQLRQVATHVRLESDVEIAGRPALHTSGWEQVEGIPVALDQYVVVSRDTVTAVTFSFTRDVPTPRRTRVMQRVLATWAWLS